MRVTRGNRTTIMQVAGGDHLQQWLVGASAYRLVVTITPNILRIYPEKARSMSGFVARAGLYCSSWVRERRGSAVLRQDARERWRRRRRGGRVPGPALLRRAPRDEWSDGASGA